DGRSNSEQNGGNRCEQTIHRQPGMPPAPLGDALAPAQLGRVLERTVFQITAQILAQMLGLLVALDRIWVQAFSDDAFQAPGGVRPMLAYRRRTPAALHGCGFDKGRKRSIGRVPGEWIAAREQLVEHYPQTVEVGTLIHGAGESRVAPRQRAQVLWS